MCHARKFISKDEIKGIRGTFSLVAIKTTQPPIKIIFAIKLYNINACACLKVKFFFCENSPNEIVEMVTGRSAPARTAMAKPDLSVRTKPTIVNPFNRIAGTKILSAIFNGKTAG